MKLFFYIFNKANSYQITTKMTTLLETIMECTPAIRCGTMTFKNAVIRYTIELVHILAIRHGFDAHEAIERLYPGYKNKQFGRYIDVEFLKELKKKQSNVDVQK